jgi:large subunit ribosomal protein L25
LILVAFDLLLAPVALGSSAMKQLKLSAEKRSVTGRQYVRKLRESGRVPAVIYGKSGTQSLSFDEKAFRMLLREKKQSAALVSVEIAGGESLLSTIADVQRDPISDRFLHVDFHEVSRSEKMTTAVPIEFVGESIGVKDFGGVLDMFRHEISVRCLPENLPGSIKIDVSVLRVGDIFHIKDLEKIRGVEFVDGGDVAIVSCKGVVDAAEAGRATDGAEEKSSDVAQEEAKLEAKAEQKEPR